MKLIDPTDDALNEAFAVEVAGWDHYPAGYPKFTSSADAVLPWLEKTGWAIYPSYFPGWGNIGWSIRIYEHDESAPLMGSSPEEGFGFAKASVVALLRSNGCEIEFT